MSVQRYRVMKTRKSNVIYRNRNHRDGVGVRKTSDPYSWLYIAVRGDNDRSYSSQASSLVATPPVVEPDYQGYLIEMVYIDVQGPLHTSSQRRPPGFQAALLTRPSRVAGDTGSWRMHARARPSCPRACSDASYGSQNVYWGSPPRGYGAIAQP